MKRLFSILWLVAGISFALQAQNPYAAVMGKKSRES
jgi:hypothetical protein